MKIFIFLFLSVWCMWELSMNVWVELLAQIRSFWHFHFSCSAGAVAAAVFSVFFLIFSRLQWIRNVCLSTSTFSLSAPFSWCDCNHFHSHSIIIKFSIFATFHSPWLSRRCLPFATCTYTKLFEMHMHAHFLYMTHRVMLGKRRLALNRFGICAAWAPFFHHSNCAQKYKEHRDAKAYIFKFSGVRFPLSRHFLRCIFCDMFSLNWWDRLLLEELHTDCIRLKKMSSWVLVAFWVIQFYG